MGRPYRPTMPFNVAMKLLVPTETVVRGVTKKVFTTPEKSSQFFGSIRTFSGTENFSNEVYTVFDTATIETWYDPSIKADCRIYICETGEEWEIKGSPEDIQMRHQFMQFKVEKVGGKS